VTDPSSTLDAGAAARCSFRVVLEHDSVEPVARVVDRDESILRRTEAAAAHRRLVARSILEQHGSRALDADRDTDRTLEALTSNDLDLIVSPSLPRDDVGRRHGAPSLLVAHRDGGPARWLPVDVHNHFVTTEGTGSFFASELSSPLLAHAVARTGRRLRKGGAWRMDLLRLAHHHRRLESLDAADSSRPFAGIIDRSSTLWWFALDDAVDGASSALALYDARFAERVALLAETKARGTDPSLPRPGAAWWHRECESCPYREACHATLAATDDVSLVRFTDGPNQTLLRAVGISTRRELAAASLDDVALGIATRDEPSDARTPIGVALGRQVRDAARLVRRARVEVRGSMLRLVDAEQLDARRRDVEIDFDMESYNNVTYLWGTLVTSRRPVAGVDDGYRSFAEWGGLTPLSEAGLFVEFFDWLSATVDTVLAAGRSVGLYCFWEHAELAQVRRAMSSGVVGLPRPAALDAVLGASLVDVHELVTSQIQTAGPAGLKVVATAAGFRWRDEAPSGEASMAWYEDALGDDEALARAATARILAYNEDDCRATRSLRDWLEGPAHDLPHVEDARPADS
jgi:predicted RecB family nuclease